MSSSFQKSVPITTTTSAVSKVKGVPKTVLNGVSEKAIAPTPRTVEKQPTPVKQTRVSNRVTASRGPQVDEKLAIDDYGIAFANSVMFP